MEDIFGQVKSLIEKFQLLTPECTVIAGVSGGPDSMALLAVLTRLRKSSDFELIAAHINHGLRENAQFEANLVRDWCQSNNVQLMEKNVNLREIARARNRSLEETGRDVRREFFFECKDRIVELRGRETIVRIALAHHMQDQAETLILNLGRGSGLDGLAGMNIFEPPFIRPLLQSDPKVIKAWLEEEKIPWLMDESNDEVYFTRNKIRHLLLPVWHDLLGYNPVPLLARAADNLGSEKKYLKITSDKVFENAIRKTDDGDIAGLECNQLANQPEAIRFRVMRRFFSEITGTARDFSKVHADLMQAVLLSDSGPFNLPAGYVVSRSGDLLKVTKKTNEEQAADIDFESWEADLQIPGDTGLPDKIGLIRAEVIEYQPDFRYNSQMNCFRLQALAGCKVRFRRPGDRIRPVGRSGTRTLKKFMNEQKVPLSERQRIPLVADGSNIVWLPKYGCGHEFCLTADNSGQSAADSSLVNDDEKNCGIRLSWHSCAESGEDSDKDSVTGDTSGNVNKLL